MFDPCIWKEADGYYSLSGSYWDGPIFGDCRMVQHLFFSQDLRRWVYLGPLVDRDIFTSPGEDAAVPYFWPIGDRHILIFASHQRGSQYLLGDYDSLHHKFKPFAHDRFNFGPIEPGGVHAPSATPDGEGGIYVIHNINAGKPTEGWDHIMSLVRHLTLSDDGTVAIEPVHTVEALRAAHGHVGETPMPANREVVLEGVGGCAVELVAEIEPQSAREVSVNVLRSGGGEEVTSIRFYRRGHLATSEYSRRGDRMDAVSIDTSRSSLLPDVMARPEEVAPFKLREGEPLRLRVFIDRSVVEVFVNGRQCLALRVYPGREDSVGVSVRAQGSDAVLRSLDAWQMKSIWRA